MPNRLSTVMHTAWILLAASAVLAPRALAQQPGWDIFPDTWTATDQLGRTLPDFAEVGPPRTDRTVGIFYFLWLDRPQGPGPFNITEILEADPQNPAWGPQYAFHHWEESQFGYYLSDDAGVIRKHMQMMADAGVDVLIFDATNGIAYQPQYTVLLDELAAMRALGLHTPQVAWFARQSSADIIFADVYAAGERTWHARNHVDDFTVGTDGFLRFEVVAADPFIESPDALDIDASRFATLELHMRNGAGMSSAQLFWTTAAEPFYDQAKSLIFAVQGPEAGVADYTVDLGTSAEWTGTVTRLRLDPVSGPLGPVEIDRIAVTDGATPTREWTFQGDHHPDLWFRWENRPLILWVTPSDPPTAEITDFFEVRQTWGLQPLDEPDEWSFLQHYPQDPGFAQGDPDNVEFMSVAIAQQETYMTAPTAHGRHYHDGAQPPEAEWTGEGLNFAEQWERALSFDPRFIFITGWNEWVAQRFISDPPQSETRFVDAYSAEFSRDIEPMKGGHADNYYYQMISYIRRYKGVREPQPATLVQAIEIDAMFEDWAGVGPEYRDTLGDPAERDHPGWGTAGPYVNDTGRNDLMSARVTWGLADIFFYARTRGDIAGPVGDDWMLLLLDADADAATGWFGYDYLVGRRHDERGNVSVEAHVGPGWTWNRVAWAPLAFTGDQLELAVARQTIGLDELPGTIHFKWADGIGAPGDIQDLTRNGDVAPNDRHNYVFTLDPTRTRVRQVYGWTLLE